MPDEPRVVYLPDNLVLEWVEKIFLANPNPVMPPDIWDLIDLDLPEFQAVGIFQKTIENPRAEWSSKTYELFRVDYNHSRFFMVARITHYQIDDDDEDNGACNQAEFVNLTWTMLKGLALYSASRFVKCPDYWPEDISREILEAARIYEERRE